MYLICKNIKLHAFTCIYMHYWVFSSGQDPVDAVTSDDDNSIASANSEDEMAVFDEEMGEEDFIEEMEFTGDCDTIQLRHTRSNL